MASLHRFIASSLLAFAASAAAEPDGGLGGFEGPADPLMLKQAPLLEEVNHLLADWHVQSPFASSEGPVGPDGYAGVELDLDNETILVYWKYGVPLPLPVLARLDDIVSRGLRLEVLKAPFSFVDLRDELRVGLGEFIAEDLPLSRLGPTRGSQGLAIGSTDPERVLSSTAYVNAVSRLKQRSKRPPENPIPVEKAPAYQHIRVTDRSPYWGGARIINPTGLGACTSGFAVGNLFGKYLLTAGHCTTHTNGVFFRNGEGLTIGDTWGAQPNDPGSRDRLDVILIHRLLNCTRPDSICHVPGQSQGVLYHGSVQPNGQPSADMFSRRVKGHVVSVPGMLVCTSGSFSGDRCDIEVAEIEQRIFTGFNFIRGTVRARHRGGQSAGGEGDSGGPVFTIRANPNEANAVGILSAMTTVAGVPCTGFPNRQCSNEVFYQTIHDAMRALDVWVEVH